MRRARVLVAIALLGTYSRRAAADTGDKDHARFTLESSTSAAASTCAGDEILRAKIAERLGRDPFATSADGRGRLHVVFARDRADAWTAEIALFDASGKRIGARSLSQTGATCAPLVGSVVFTLAVMLEELAPLEPAPPPTAPSSPPPPAPVWPETTPDAPPRVPTPPTTRSTRVDVSLGGAGTLGGAPAPSGGGELALGLDLARLRIELSGRMFLPASSDGDVGVRTRLVHGRLAPCYGWAVLAGCVVAAVGGVSGEAIGEGVVSSRLAGQLYAAGGIGVLSRVFLVEDVLFVRASVDLLFAATRAGFDVGDRRVWTVPVVAAGGAVALGVRLP